MLFGALSIETFFQSFTQSLISNSEIGSHIVSHSFLPIYSSSLFIKNPNQTLRLDWT